MTATTAITLTKVDSSQIAAIGHDAATETLAIQFFRKGEPADVYHYANFTAAEYAAFAGAPSVGKHFYAHIKPHADKHPYENMGMPAAPVEALAAQIEADHAQALDINARCFGAPLSGGQRYSRTTFKDNGDPILLNADGSRSVFCDLCDDVEDVA